MGEPLIVNGTPFDTPSSAARALGLSTSAVYKAKREGRLDKLGVSGKHGKPEPVELFRHTWPTMAQCCSDLDCAETTLRKVMRGEASERQVANMRKRVEAWSGKKVTAPAVAPVTADTPVFPTTAALPRPGAV